jgi:hypothetical protein
LSFWTSVTQYLRTQKAHAVKTFEDLIIAGLTSPRKAIVNTTITVWNDLVLEVGEAPLDCTEKITQIVQQLYHVADIRLPYGVEPDDQLVCTCRSWLLAHHTPFKNFRLLIS